jgi:Rhodopirellula transposase DDE domain
VGVDHDTSVFAVESIRRWWRARGRRDYPKASRLLITADAGGSNGYRYLCLEERTGHPGSQDRAGDHGLPLPTGHLQVE